MALIKCIECGHEVSDKANICPHCGCPIENDPKKTCEECGQQLSENDTICPHCGCPVQKEDGLLTKKISTNEGVSTPPKPVENKKKGPGLNEKQKIVIVILILFPVVFFIMIAKCSHTDTPSYTYERTEESSSYDTTESESDSKSDFNSQKSDDPYNTIVGTYEFSDNINTWVLIVNNDETAVIYNKSKGGNVKGYGSWYKYSTMKYATFHFHDKAPIVWFPSGEETMSSPRLTEDWIYYDSSAADAKNPEKRLPVKKVK